jgi:hypothetical protein
MLLLRTPLCEYRLLTTLQRLNAITHTEYAVMITLLRRQHHNSAVAHSALH